MRGEIPESDNQRAMNSTIGVFPLPPHVKFPTLITGTGNLSNKNISNELNKINFFFHFTKAVLGTTFRALSLMGTGRKENKSREIFKLGVYFSSVSKEWGTQHPIYISR